MLYKQTSELPDKYVRDKLAEFFKEDIPAYDVTSEATIPEKKKVAAKIVAAEDLVFAGSKIIEVAFENCDRIDLYLLDGASVLKGDAIAQITGDAKEILAKERVVLNLLQRLCGVSTLASKYAKITNPRGVKALDTRKTTPGIRLFEKFAVAAGGGANHRMDLSSGVLIKDNHIAAAGGVKAALENLAKANVSLPVQLEVDTIEQIKEALEIGVDAFLLDNMDPKTVRTATKLIRKRDSGIFIEASGGITLETLDDYAKTGIDAISVGAITHGAKSVDIKMEFEPV